MSSPKVATTSPSHSPPDERRWVDQVTAASENMRLARMHPTQEPTTWAAA